MGHPGVLHKLKGMGVEGGNDSPMILLAVPVLPHILADIADTPWILANWIQNGTPGLSTQTEPGERIG